MIERSYLQLCSTIKLHFCKLKEKQQLLEENSNLDNLEAEVRLKLKWS